MNISKFEKKLISDGKSNLTIKKYLRVVENYLEWAKNSYGKIPKKLYRENFLEYISYLRNVKTLNANTINNRISAIRTFNEFLRDAEVQPDIVIQKNDYIKIQSEPVSLTNVSEAEVKNFIQTLLEKESKRNYAMAVTMAYTGIRVGEIVKLKLDDINLQTGEMIIRSGKGNKQRVVHLNSKVRQALSSYLKVREKDICPYLFLSTRKGKLDTSAVNRVFNKYSDKITPHTLRHFFCTNALEKGLGIHEVAYLAGHSDVQTTLRYINPTREELKRKIELL